MRRARWRAGASALAVAVGLTAGACAPRAATVGFHGASPRVATAASSGQFRSLAVAPASTTAPAAPPAAAVVAPPSAPTTTVTTIAAPAASLDARGQRALAQLQHGVPNLGYTVLFLPGQAGYLGKGFHEERRIEIYVRDGESDAMLAHVVAHELGHAVDYVTHTPERDAAYLRLRGVDPTTAWAPCGFCEDFGAPSGDFAEVYARWQVGAATPFFSRLAAPPSDDTLAAFGRLVAP